MLIAALLASQIMIGAGGHGIAGYDKLHWFESKQDIARDYPNFEEWSAPELNVITGKLYERHFYGLQTHIAGGCQWKLELEFSENRLTVVRLNQRAEDEEDCYEPTRKVLSEKYGPDYEIAKFSSDLISFNVANGSVGILKLPRKDGRIWTDITYQVTLKYNPADYDQKQRF